jgi:murein DD-endopeptidase MepM/ murein hydrolase activator NlpD
MSKRFVTLMVIPHNEDRVREFHISRPIVWGLSAAVLVTVCALFYYAAGYYLNISREAQVATLQRENSELQTHLGRLHDNVKGLRGRLDELSEMDRRMRAWANLKEPGEDVRQLGIGGTSEEGEPWEGGISFEAGEMLSQAYVDVEQLVREARFLKGSFENIAEALSQDDETRRHTPSISPIPPDAEYWYSSGFGWRTDPFTGRRVRHLALDIAGHTGTDVLATADGIVDRVRLHKRLGWYVAINHGSEYRTIYGHLQKNVVVKEGQEVQRGQVIGYLGKSGRTTAPHVHYAVTKNRRALNPKNFIIEQDNKSLTAIY